MLQSDVEKSADVRQFGRSQVPCPPGELHRANEWHRWHLQSGRQAARLQHFAIEAGIMSDEMVRTVEQWRDLRPHIAKGRLIGHVAPSDAVDIAEDHPASRRPNQPSRAGDNLAAFDSNEADSARAVGAVVGSLEIDGDKC